MTSGIGNTSVSALDKAAPEIKKAEAAKAPEKDLLADLFTERKSASIVNTMQKKGQLKKVKQTGKTVGRGKVASAPAKGVVKKAVGGKGGAGWKKQGNWKKW